MMRILILLPTFRDFLDKLRPLTRFSSQAEHTAVASSLWRERELRLRLTELVRYRRNGITSSEECSHFERHAAVNNGTTNSHPVNARAAAVLARMAVYALARSPSIMTETPKTCPHSQTPSSAFEMRRKFQTESFRRGFSTFRLFRHFINSHFIFKKIIVRA